MKATKKTAKTVKKKSAADKASARKAAPAKPKAKSAPVATQPAKPKAKSAPVATQPAARKAIRKPERETAAPSADLWQLIEEAWASVAPELAEARARPTEDNLEELDDGAAEMLETLRSKLETLDEDALLAVDRTLERALYKIDRQEVQEVTDGSDDGFLYARGFIVAMGKRFFDAVDADPSVAVCDAELEEMCYLPLHVYRARFGEPPQSGISRESGSNQGAW